MKASQRDLAGNERLTLERKLERIAEFTAAHTPFDLGASLLHAYVACLTKAELCEVALRTMNGDEHLRRPIRIRLLRIARDGGAEGHLDQLGLQLLEHKSTDYKVRARVDALLSALFSYLAPTTRATVLERWRDRGTSGAAARWLKAISSDELLFDIAVVLSYWRATGDARAAKLLAYRGDESLLNEILPELVMGCDEGWIVSKAAMKASAIGEDCWLALRDKLPASYAYLCAKLGRPITDSEGVDLVRAAASRDPGEDTGLAIWALGQLGMWTALEQVREELPQLQQTLMKLRTSELTEADVGSV